MIDIFSITICRKRFQWNEPTKGEREPEEDGWTKGDLGSELLAEEEEPDVEVDFVDILMIADEITKDEKENPWKKKLKMLLLAKRWWVMTDEMIILNMLRKLRFALWWRFLCRLS